MRKFRSQYDWRVTATSDFHGKGPERKMTDINDINLLLYQHD